MSGPILNLAVLGSGQMGSGIAQVAAQSNKNVILFDVDARATEHAKKNIGESLQKLKTKNLLQGEPAEILKRIQFVTDVAQVKNVHFIIEAVTEDFKTKKFLFEKFDEALPREVIFASNTSSISISKLASTTKRPDRFIGMHFMNPVPLMKLVEMISGDRTSPDVAKQIDGLAREMGKIVVHSRDRAGFIVNRILMPMINEAFFALEEKIASAEDIDQAMKTGTNQPMGPLALADYIGLDTCVFIMNVMHEGLGQEKFRPAPLLLKYVSDGKVGKKCGQGVYEY